MTVRNDNIAKFCTQLERQAPLKIYTDKRGSRIEQKLMKAGGENLFEGKSKTRLKISREKIKETKRLNRNDVNPTADSHPPGPL